MSLFGFCGLQNSSERLLVGGCVLAIKLNAKSLYGLQVPKPLGMITGNSLTKNPTRFPLLVKAKYWEHTTHSRICRENGKLNNAGGLLVER